MSMCKCTKCATTCFYVRDADRYLVAGRQHSSTNRHPLHLAVCSATLITAPQTLDVTVMGFDESEPVLRIPVGHGNDMGKGASIDQNNNLNRLAVINEGFCIGHEVVFTLQFNLNPRSTEIYKIVDSAGAPQFSCGLVPGLKRN